MSEKYRDRVASFVNEMVTDPLLVNDEYMKNWHKKYSDNRPIG